MDSAFWLNTWEIGKINFHLNEYNQTFVKHLPKFHLNKGSHLFIPLCGKSKDIQWALKQNLTVTGIDLSPVAIESFFEENKMEYKVESIGQFKKYSSGNLTLFQGDFFDLDPSMIPEIQMIYDRAATVALPFEMRTHYLKKLHDFLPKNGQILFILFEYDQSLIEGPPFSVGEEEIYHIFQESCSIKILNEEKVKMSSKKFQESRNPYALQKTYQLTSK